jgi:hypothetical protein
MAQASSVLYTCDDGVSQFMIRQLETYRVAAGNALAGASVASAPRGFRPRHFHLKNPSTGQTIKLMAGQVPLTTTPAIAGFNVVGYTGEKTEGANGIDLVARLI